MTDSNDFIGSGPGRTHLVDNGSVDHCSNTRAYGPGSRIGLVHALHEKQARYKIDIILCNVGTVGEGPIVGRLGYKGDHRQGRTLDAGLFGFLGQSQQPGDTSTDSLDFIQGTHDLRIQWSFRTRETENFGMQKTGRISGIHHGHFEIA